MQITHLKIQKFPRTCDEETIVWVGSKKHARFLLASCKGKGASQVCAWLKKTKQNKNPQL